MSPRWGLHGVLGRVLPGGGWEGFALVNQRSLREGKPRQKNPGPPSMGVGQKANYLPPENKLQLQKHKQEIKT